jgi:hypothetical protein
MDKDAIESIIHGEIMEIQNYFEEWDTPGRYKPETYEENRMYDACRHRNHQPINHA